MRTYIPAKIKFGRIAKTRPLELSREEIGAYAEASILTCKDARRAWVNVGNFKTLVGYQPAASRDIGKEMMKTVTGAVGEVENEPLEGFALEGGVRDGVDLSDTKSLARNPPRNGCAFVRDPRGPLVVVNAGDLAAEIADGRVLVDAGGRLSGRFAWGLVKVREDRTPPHFRLLAESGAAYRGAERETEVTRARAEIAFVTAGEMVAGTVYRRSSSKDPGSTKYTRVVYLGRLRCPPTTLMKAMFAYADYLEPIGNYSPKPQEEIMAELRGRRSPYGRDTYLPWRQEAWIDTCRAYREWCATDGLQHVFALLLPVSSYVYRGYRLRLSPTSQLTLDWMVHVRACPKWIEKNIRARDDDQEIAFEPERRYYDGPDAERFSAEALTQGVAAGAEELARKMEQAMALFPTEAPPSLADYEARLLQLPPFNDPRSPKRRIYGY